MFHLETCVEVQPKFESKVLGISIAQWIAFLLCTQQPWVRFLALPGVFLLILLRFIDGTVDNRGQRLNNVNPTH